MKLLNITEEAPNEYYIFVDQLNPMTAHNLEFTGQFFSGAAASADVDKSFLVKYLGGTANYLPFSPRESDLKAPSPYFLTALNDSRIEYDAEIYRKDKYPKYPSRLSALYAFGDYDTCLCVSEKYGWNIKTVKKFRLKDWEYTRVIKVNMEHVSLARHAYRISTVEDPFRIWEGYWSGEGNVEVELPTADFKRERCSSGVIWEYLIEGSVMYVK